MSSVPRPIATNVATSSAAPFAEDAVPLGYHRQIRLAYWAGAMMFSAAIWAAILL